jgi:peptidylprolyl isomerase
MTRLRSWSLVALAASAFGLAACGNSSGPGSTTPTTAGTSSNSGTGPTTTTTTPASTTSTTGTGSASAIAPIPAADRSAAGTAGAPPTLTVPTGQPPTQLESADLIAGTGPAAKAGDALTVEYELGTYSSHSLVQSSWTSQPFQLTLGAGQVIPGWDQGLVGMKAGGRRELIIPPSLGYRDQSPGPGIAANDTLVFIIDLQKIN